VKPAWLLSGASLPAIRLCLSVVNVWQSLEGNVTNPFEDENGTYHVLTNDEGQHSLWPSFVEVPNGWTIILKSDTRAACLEFIEKNWTDMRPKSLIAAMEGSPEGQPPKTDQTEEIAAPSGHDDSKENAKTLH
jgi:MbtH protein